MSYTDLRGRRFGKLTVTSLSRFGAGGKVRVWNCICDCGATAEAWTQKLTSGKKDSCGCDDPRRYNQKNGWPRLTAARLREVLDYERETGILRWKVSLGGKGKAGERAGCIQPHGHRTLAIDGRLYRAARICWMHVHSEMPNGLVDHRNGVRDDDRWENLRLATHAENTRNSAPKSKKPGHLKGAFRAKDGARWFSSIKVDGKLIQLGRFDTQQEAHEAYGSAAIKYFGEFARPA